MRKPPTFNTSFKRRGNELPYGRFSLNVRTRITDTGTQPHDLPAGERQGYLGPLIEGKVPYITTSHRSDLLHAFDKRINFHTSLRASKHVEDTSRRLVRLLVPTRMPTFDWDSELFEEWIDKFDTEKQKRMRLAYEGQGLQTIKDYSDKEIFTKVESLVKPPEKVKGRVIFKGTDLYNAISGPIFLELMRRLKATESNHRLGYKFQVAYKETTDQIASFIHSGPKETYLEADFTANDKYQCKSVQWLEIYLMRRLGCPEWFVRLHRQTNRFRVLNGKYGLMAWVENQLPTGATDTTFRNTFWNLCIFNCWWYDYKPGFAHVAILGDDMLAGLSKWPRQAAKKYERTAQAARMEAKVSCHPDITMCHFLSKHFYRVECQDEPVMLPFLGKVLAKFNTRPNNNTSVSDDEYMAGKALSACYEFRYCHDIRDMFARRAFIHLERTGNKFSMEGVSWNVRESALQFELLALDVLREAALTILNRGDGVGHDVERRADAMNMPNKITRTDMLNFWLPRFPTVGTAELLSGCSRVICHEDPVVLGRIVLQSLVDY
jgi:hypothetical protein